MRRDRIIQRENGRAELFFWDKYDNEFIFLNSFASLQKAKDWCIRYRFDGLENLDIYFEY